MITEQDYITSLRIVEAYHKQIGILPLAKKTIDDLREGDLVKCIAIKPGTTSFEIGRDYLIKAIHSKLYGYGPHRRMWIKSADGKERSCNLNPLYWNVANDL